MFRFPHLLQTNKKYEEADNNVKCRESLGKGLLSCEDQKVTVLAFAGHMVSVMLFRSSSERAIKRDLETNRYAPI